MRRMSAEKFVCVMTIVLVAIISTNMSHPLSKELSDRLYDRLMVEGALIVDGQDIKRTGRMGWRKCNPLFNFRCGKKTVFSYQG